MHNGKDRRGKDRGKGTKTTSRGTKCNLMAALPPPIITPDFLERRIS
jgi:hypothetical protein